MTGQFGYPVFLELHDRLALVAGGGHEPTAKARALVEAGARVRHWAPVHAPGAGLHAVAGVEVVTGGYVPDLLDDVFLAIVGTGDRTLDRRIATDARAARVLVNTIDDIAFCDWSAPAILRRGELTIAIGTGGVAPALAVRLRDRLAAEIGTEYGALLNLFAAVRPRIMASGRSFSERRTLWYELVDGPAAAALRDGREADARACVEDRVTTWLDGS